MSSHLQNTFANWRLCLPEIPTIAVAQPESGEMGGALEVRLVFMLFITTKEGDARMIKFS